MGNTIEKAISYVNNQAEVLRMFNTSLLCVDLLKNNIEHKGNVVSYDEMSFGSYTMGSFNSRSGLGYKDLIFARKTRILSQDRGDTVDLDKKEKNEAQLANDLVGAYNFYQVRVAIPTMDAYAYGKLVEVGNGAEVSAHGTIDATTIVADLYEDFAKLGNKRIKTAECIVYIGETNKGYLDQASINKGILSIGSWGGNLDAQAVMIKGAKIVSVPDEYLSNVAWVIVHPLAFDVVPVLDMVDFFDRVPGKPGISQVDIREYFDAWTQPGGESGILIGVQTPRALVAPANANFTPSLNVKVTGIETGASVFYTDDGTAPTSASAAYVVADGVTITATKTLKFIQYVNGVASAVTSGTYTKSQ